MVDSFTYPPREIAEQAFKQHEKERTFQEKADREKRRHEQDKGEKEDERLAEEVHKAYPKMKEPSHMWTFHVTGYPLRKMQCMCRIGMCRRHVERAQTLAFLKLG